MEPEARAEHLEQYAKSLRERKIQAKGFNERIFGDVLKQDIKGLVAEKMQGLRPVVCANLPYNVTSPLITAFLEAECFDSVTVMIQREVARRICAKPGTGDYGAFTVFVNWFAQPELLFDVSPGSMPKTSLACLGITICPFSPTVAVHA